MSAYPLPAAAAAAGSCNSASTVSNMSHSHIEREIVWTVRPTWRAPVLPDRRRRSCGVQCAARISPMNTLVSSVNTNACRNATNSSNSMMPVAITDAATPTR